MARRDEPDGATDPTRREFFRTFGRQTVRSAGTVIGAAAELRRAGGSAARELLDLGSAGRASSYVDATPRAETVASFSSAYRLDEDSLLLLDQRGLPGRMTVVTCREPTEVASAIRLGVVTGGPILGEICAYALAITAARTSDATATRREQAFRAAANTLRVARREVHALSAAVSRMESRYDGLTADSDGGVHGANLAAALRAEADAIATEAQLAHAALGRSGAQAIAAAAGEQINLIVHGDMGPLSCGIVGTGTAIVRSLLERGRKVHVWLTEGAPSMEGSRVGGFQLTQMEVPHTVIPDTAVGWLLSSREINAALVRGDTVCGNGDTIAPIGSLNVARLATDTGVPVHVVAPSTAFDPDAPDRKSVTLDVHSPAELAAHTIDAANRRPAVVAYRLSPAADVVPAPLVTSFLTEAGPRPGGRS